MKRHVGLCMLICILSIATGGRQLRAQWADNGIGVCTAANSQEDCRIISDGEGGSIVCWRDDRLGGNLDIYAQKLDRHGNELWTAGGVAVCSAIYTQWQGSLASDGAGGAILVWTDLRNGSAYHVYAQRVSDAGTPLWQPNGVPVCTLGTWAQYPSIIPDGEGGAITTWQDNRTFDDNIYAQKLDATGSIIWTANGQAICTASQDQDVPVLTSDGEEGAIIAWNDARSGTYDVYAQRVDSGGTVLWTANGEVISAETNGQNYPDLIPDGAGGAYITWYDFRVSWDNADIYAQHVDQNGSVQWAANGVVVCNAANHQYNPNIVPDEDGGAIIAWQDKRLSHWNVYAQRIDYTGATQWPAEADLCTEVNDQTLLDAVSDDAGGALVAWKDERISTMDPNIFIQRVDHDGNTLWATNGIDVVSTPGYQVNPYIAADGLGGAIVAWPDSRNGNWDIYAQRIERNGYWGYPCPTLDNVADVPLDQGGRVSATWDRSRLDHFAYNVITHYSIWRSLTGGELLALEAAGAQRIDLRDVGPDLAGPAYYLAPASAGGYGWELLHNMNALQIEQYTYTAETLYDSTGAGSGQHHFFIAAHTEDPFAFWSSDPDSGYSVDNLAPSAPMALAGEQSFVPEGLSITWAPNTEADLHLYNVYRGTSEGFTPAPGNLIASPGDTCCFDSEWHWDGGYYYKVSAADIHGNESPFALLVPEDVTGEPAPVTPLATFLAQNFPNPFNPVTRVAFGLTEAADVHLRIYDASGRLVRVLVNEHREAGSYEEAWDGRDASGVQAASGVYFYRLVAGSFEETKKMVLLR